jgi:hypothetical protein
VNIDDALTIYGHDLVAGAARWHASRRRSRRRRIIAVASVSGTLAAVLAATPAWALVREVLPFWDQPAAPQSVMVDFSDMNVGAPPGNMSPEAEAGEARQITQATFGGETHTLWVSPAKNGGFCFLWSGSGGGCNTTHDTFPLADSVMLVQPHDANEPAQTTLSSLSDVRALGQDGVVEWLTGYALAPDVKDVVIRFSDGATVHPEITWVSAPIGAGFFAYDVPNDRQSATDHATEIDSYDASGRLVRHEQLPPAHQGG